MARVPSLKKGNLAIESRTWVIYTINAILYKSKAKFQMWYSLFL